MKPEREYQMSDNVDLFINLNDKNDADKVLTIIKREASKITPEYPTEIERFIDGIQVEGNTVKTEANYSLVIGSFFELMPKIMMEIAVGSFGPITMEAAFFIRTAL